MAEVRIEHTFDCSVETFWNQVFFDDDYNQRLFMKALEFERFKVVSVEETATGKKRVIDASPKLGDLPLPLKKLVGDGIGYRETGMFDAKTKRYKSVIVTSKLSDKISIEGDYWLEPLGEKKCKRIFTCRVTAKIFGVGGLLEKRVIADMEASYRDAAKFTNEYLREKGLG